MTGTLWRAMWGGHVGDRHLLALCVDPDGVGRARGALEGHVRACARCAARYAALEAFVAELQADGVETADEVFSPERLLAQRHRIMRRVERLLAHHGPARVLPFPTVGRVALPAVRRARRVIAAAAAAGMLVGVLASRFVLLQERPRSRAGAAPQATMAPPSEEPARATPSEPPLPGADERLLLEIEDALGAPRVEELRAIDAMTPRVRDVALNLR